MYGPFGRFQLADTFGAGQRGKLVACIGDKSSHGGTITTHNQDGTLTAMDELVAVDQAHHVCPIEGHNDPLGYTLITPITIKSFHNEKLILTEKAVSGCGARIAPMNRRTFVE